LLITPMRSRSSPSPAITRPDTRCARSSSTGPGPRTMRYCPTADHLHLGVVIRPVLVGYENWADYDAEVKMIGSGAAIKEFIDDVADMARESAERDYAIVLERLREDHPGARAVSLADKDYYAEL